MSQKKIGILMIAVFAVCMCFGCASGNVVGGNDKNGGGKNQNEDGGLDGSSDSDSILTSFRGVESKSKKFFSSF